MTSSEPSSKEDESPAPKSPANDTEIGQKSNDEPETQPNTRETNQPQESNQEAKTDEFGLPVKKIGRRSTSGTEHTTASEDSESKAHAGTAPPQEPIHRREKSGVDIYQGSNHTDEGKTSRLPATDEPSSQVIEVPIKASTEQPAQEPELLKGNETSGLRDTSIEEPHKVSSTDASRRSTTDKILHGQTGSISGWSHQALASQKPVEEEKKDNETWQSMPAYAQYDLYDDDGHLLAKEAPDSDEEANAYHGTGGAGKGYTRVQNDEDAQSATSMDDNTDYLFKQVKGTDLSAEDDEARDPLAQLQATKDLLTEGQRIAYVGVTRLAFAEMVKELEEMDSTRKTKKEVRLAFESMKMWSQKMMVRLYAHMDIDQSEQVMIEQLTEHGVLAADLTPLLMQNARVKNPMADEGESTEDTKKESKTGLEDESEGKAKDTPEAEPQEQSQSSANGSSKTDSIAPASSKASPEITEKQKIPLKSLGQGNERHPSIDSSQLHSHSDPPKDEPLPPYKEHDHDEPFEDVRGPSQLGNSKNIDIDLRWTVLCDLFLVLLADSIYDARSRTLLERVGKSLEVSGLDICRFEKRVTEALEMQEEAEKETWDEAEHIEARRKLALKRRYMMMGIATVGGSLVIGLSAGLLAPVIGAGMAAGFTTIGVAGTSGFLAGAGGTALITSAAVATGGTIAVRASDRRTGAVSTFEYRPLHNNKRVNLIISVSGWMNGKVDDVRLPFSTVNPVMGDMYSILWEPEMMQSMGQTINVLASEALSQTVQQVLGSTILIALMSALQLPIVLTKLSYFIDNPWTVSMARANAAGLILADSLIDRHLGMRPVTLVGFSLGARVIFSAIRELARRGAFGIVHNCFLFGSPIVANRDEYIRVRSMISGRFVNGYASNDWILGYLFRATAGGVWKVAGLAPVANIPGLENINCTELVNGHMAYRAAMPKLLREKLKWDVDSDEFTEIEDPDPENHDKRQRELIRELEDARTDVAQKPEKKRFGLFKRGKLARKKGWETYDASMKDGGEDDFSTAAAEGVGANVLFDIEAIKRELESEQIDVREIESTMPPMKLNVNGSSKNVDHDSRPNAHETRSYDETMVYETRQSKAASSASSLPNGRDQKFNPFNKGYDEYNLSGETVNATQKAEEPKLSFESQRRTPSPLPSPRYRGPDQQAPSPLKDAQSSTPPPRPSIQTTLSSPASVGIGGGPVSFEHNAWLDEEDDDFGKEQEVKMTF
ncbi:uncharacterized protein KY384_008450 [Bacidia gigantensis]|uniref:uncharacterized protein n=1 Tax=Bacidia gigantensis TaxID=2732470 RepID=UPI001D050E9D|nr:uncharacterized protein KY384_008450 [Bacidia gigantensis]KAG8527021.1 hypothetical protein KY384_008450 [Bacidia gigantensis]